MPKPKKSSKKIVRPLVGVFLIVVLLVGIGGQLLVMRLHVPLPPLQPRPIYTVAPATTKTAITWPSLGQAAVGAVGYGVLDSNGAQLPVPTASIAKLITTVAVLKVKPIAAGQTGPTLTMTQADVDLYNSYVARDGSVVAVAVGEQLTEYQALQAMLLPSANNIADSLAIWAFGSLDAYASYANQLLSSDGLGHTHVGSDASGFSPTTTSTANDLVKLGEIAIAIPVIADITSQPSADLPLAGTVHNVNWLLGTSGINGLKTGNSDQAGGTYLFSSSYTVAGKQKVTIVGAVLGAPTLWQAMNGALPLLITTQQAFGYTTALTTGQAVAVYSPAWSRSITAVAVKPVQALAWQGNVLSQPIVKLSTVAAPAAMGTIVGAVSFGSASDSSPVVLSQPIPKPSLWWRLPH